MHRKHPSDLQLARLAKGTEKLMATLLPVLTTYHPVFASQFCQTDEQTQGVIAQYAKRMLDEGIDAAGFERGIRALEKRAATERFAPNPSEFAVMCKATPADLGIPDFHQVLADVTAGKQATRFGESYVFAHPLARVICGRKGDLIYTLTSIEFEDAIRAEYDHWVKRLQAGEQLPEPQLTIGHDQRPDMPAELRLAPVSPLAQRVEAMRAEAAARKGNNLG